MLLGFREMVLYFTNTGPRQISKSRKKKQMRPSLDHFGHHFFLSWGVCEAIPGSPRALLVQLGVVNTNAILHSWSLVDLQTLPCRCYNSCFCNIAFVCFLLFRGGGGGRGEPIYPNARTETLLVDALVQTIGIFGTDRAYRPRDRYTDHWEL